ncbi:hypothetical protein [Leifsonia sp. TF02-11]|uniref:hypothetical protein n=1 Tax=Leifsonia sp. TF02-11 TaxID=2815212 RepID=UPI001AA18BD3|nr:hypothetical protein [Leifsonia sp. TF02-11]MBO1739152.1 hypothetical protein [Leifsonia sp. TF02-11]
MKQRTQRWLVSGATVVVLGAAVTYGVVAYADYRSRVDQAVDAAATPTPTLPTGQLLVFRSTAPGAGYGHVASVPLADTSAKRTDTGLACDRVYATHENLMCLHTDSGTVTSFTATLYDGSGAKLKSWPLPGVPSRTRISADSSLVAQTSFVTGSSYGSEAFSTETTISAVRGTDYGSLEDFTLLVDGTAVTADRDFWGVTFASDDNTFFATAASGGHTWLVRGNLRGRTMVAIHDGAECPSLSPDGTKIAYKKNTSTNPAVKHWTLAVLDFATGVETRLPITDSVDDQAEWLNGSTLLYGLANPAKPGDSTVYSVAIDGTSAPQVFLHHAWSPSVVR